ncbi:hypothetical protein D3C72_1390040 [compost metagenome]
MQHRTLRHRHQIAGRRLAKAHYQTLLFGLPQQPETGATAIAVLWTGDHRLLLRRNAGFASDHSHQGRRLALLLQAFIRVLLLATAAHAKVWAARFDTLRAAAEQSL